MISRSSAVMSAGKVARGGSSRKTKKRSATGCWVLILRLPEKAADAYTIARRRNRHQAVPPSNSAKSAMAPPDSAGTGPPG